MARLGVSVWLMHRRESTVEAELETLRDVNNRQPITREQLDMALTQIEEDVAGSRNARRHPVARRRPSKRSR